MPCDSLSFPTLDVGGAVRSPFQKAVLRQLVYRVFEGFERLFANERRSSNGTAFSKVQEVIIEKRWFETLFGEQRALTIRITTKINLCGRVRSRITNVLQALSIEFCYLCSQRCKCRSQEG